MDISLSDTKFYERPVYINPNGELYRDFQLGRWALCKSINGVDAVIVLEPLAEYNYRLDLI